MPSALPTAASLPASPSSKLLRVAVPSPLALVAPPAVGAATDNFDEYVLPSGRSRRAGSGAGVGGNRPQTAGGHRSRSPPRPSFMRQSLPLRSTTISIFAEASSARRPGSAHAGLSGRRRQELHNGSAHENDANSNVRRRQRLHRLIQISSGQISAGDHPNAYNAEHLQSEQKGVNGDSSFPSRRLEEQQRTQSTYERQPQCTKVSQSSLNGTGSFSNYSGAHGRGVTISELRKQFRAVRAYAMSGPDARRIRIHGIDPQADVPDLRNYYSTVEVEGIPLPMGNTRFGLLSGSATDAMSGSRSVKGIEGNTEDMALGMSAVQNGLMDIGGDVTAAGISPWGGVAFSLDSPEGGSGVAVSLCRCNIATEPVNQ